MRLNNGVRCSILRNHIGWVATAIALLCCLPARGQETDTYLVAVQYDVYLKRDNPLYPFAVDHPCGAVVTLQANKLPINVQSIELEWAHEVDSMGRTKTRWPLPIDASPLAIDGNRLIIHQFNAEEIVSVTVEGEIGIGLNGAPKAPSIESKAENLVKCPEGVDEGNLCSRLIDATTGTPRIIAYPPACT